MQAALGRTLVASGGTILVLGGATMVVSTVSMGVTKIVIDRSKKHLLVKCPVCSGSKTLSCSVCEEERTLRYIPSTAPPALPGSKMASTMCACAMCEGCGLQTCPNCLGEGLSYPDKFEWAPWDNSIKT